MTIRLAPSRLSASLSVAALLASVSITATVAADASIALKISRATAVRDARTGKPILAIQLDQATAQAFARFSSENVGSKIEFRVDGKVLAAPVIREPISSGAIQIDLGDQANTAADLAAQISRSDAKVEVVVSH